MGRGLSYSGYRYRCKSCREFWIITSSQLGAKFLCPTCGEVMGYVDFVRVIPDRLFQKLKQLQYSSDYRKRNPVRRWCLKTGCKRRVRGRY